LQKVRARDAGQTLTEAFANRGGRNIVVKIDAEGAEYEILHSIARSGVLGQIDLLFLEWHARPGFDPEEIRQVLRKAGFQWFERGHPEAPVGMFTAYRR
jgi:hypothetical protein